jgi:metacaspase-1
VRIRAVLVGVDVYERPEFPPLTGCANDVALVRRVLKRYFGVPNEDIHVLVNQRATRARILDRLELIVRSAQQDDVVVFYFSGHGSQIRDRDGDELSDGLDELLCPYDMDWDRERYIVDDELDELFREIPPGAVLEVFLDCCFWGAAPMELEPEPRPHGLRIDVRYLAPPLDIASRFEGDEERLGRHGFEDCGCFRDRNVLWAASAEGQPAAEDYLDGRPQGVFTYWGCRFIEANIDQIWHLGYGRDQLVSDLREYMDSLGYAQTAQLSAPPPLQAVGPFLFAPQPELRTRGFGRRQPQVPTRR